MRNILIVLTAYIVSSSLFAEERASVHKMSAVLDLPDNSQLDVDVFDRCALGNRNVGALLFSDEQVDIYASALDIKWGIEIGNKLRTEWYSKKNQLDPRLPTYIVVINNSGNVVTSNAGSLTSKNNQGNDGGPEQPPTFFGNCGGSVHDTP